YTGSIVKGEVMVRMLDDIGDLFGQAADDGTPIRDVVGDDPVAFADVFIQNYAAGQWTGRERKRLTDALARTVADEARLPQTSH
ncbi:DUF1048 domain-containing protein, partial [Rhizobium johnstonii]|uniref:DUF1048 domain-containing protein n=1 Tax=Rhizobium johnstonii TaxID=3019933 RepID=UPI003F953A25